VKRRLRRDRQLGEGEEEGKEGEEEEMPAATPLCAVGGVASRPCCVP
jgi:hypothetical protein